MGEVIDKVKGKVKQAAGKAIGDHKLERKGNFQELRGKAKGVVKRAKVAAEDALEE
jgi:uncharacterized protein YjbJ (UPF0337 family)